MAISMGTCVGVGAGIPNASSFCSKAKSLSGRPVESVTGEASMIISLTVSSLSSKAAIWSARAISFSSKTTSPSWGVSAVDWTPSSAKRCSRRSNVITMSLYVRQKILIGEFLTFFTFFSDIRSTFSDPNSLGRSSLCL